MPSYVDENGNITTTTGNNVANTDNGKINGQQIASALGGAASVFGTAYSTYGDVHNAKDWIPRINSFQAGPNYGGSSFDSWTQAYLNNKPLRHLSLSDVGYNTGKGIMNTIGAGVQGAGAGASFGPWGALAGGIIGTIGGLFGMGAAKRKAQKTRDTANKAVDYTNSFNIASLNNTLNNIRNDQYNNLLRNYSAFGGPLNISGDGVLSPFGNRFDWGGMPNPFHGYGSDWTNGLTFINKGGTHEQNPYDGVQMGIDPQGIPNLVEEGEVVWNDYVFSNRMKVPNKERVKYRLTGPKSLTYAEAAKKLSKESEERPNDPISKKGLNTMLGRLAESQENDREKKEMRKIKEQARKLGMTPEEYMYAMQQQEQQQPMMAAYGGELFTDGLDDGIMYAKGGKIHINPKNRGKFNATKKRTGKTTEELTHSKNPLTRKRAIFAQNAKKWKHGLGGNLFLPGGSMDNYSMYGPWDNYIQDPTDPRFYNLGIWDPELTPSYGTSEGITTQGTPANNSILSKRIVFPYENLAQHFAIPESTQKQVQANVKSNITKNNLGPGVVKGSDYDWMTGLRFAPVLGSAFSLARNLLTPADYSRANEVARAYNNVNDIAVTPKYNYMTYKPIDRMIMANMIGQQAAATRRNIMNTSGGNRGTAIAGLLASDNQYLNKLGEAFIAGDAENYKRYAQTLGVNNDINKWLADVDFNVQRANQGAAEVRAKGIQTSRAMMDAIDAQRGAAISNDLTNLTQGLGDIGWEQFNRNMVNTSNPLYSIDSSGNVYYDPRKMAKQLDQSEFNRWMVLSTKPDKTKDEEKELRELQMRANRNAGGRFAQGGYLTIKGRRRNA